MYIVHLLDKDENRDCILIPIALQNWYRVSGSQMTKWITFNNEHIIFYGAKVVNKALSTILNLASFSIIVKDLIILMGKNKMSC
jgi:hypothetical protein